MGKIYWHIELKTTQKEESRLSVRIKLGKERKSIALGQSVELKYWNKVKKRVIVEDITSGGTQTKGMISRYKKLNKFLDYLDKEIPSVLEIHKDWEKVKPSPFSSLTPADNIIESIKAVIDSWYGKEKQEQENLTMTPIRFFEEYNKTLEDKTNKLSGTLVSKGTKLNYSVILNRFKKFLEYYKFEDSFAIFDKSFQSKWESFHFKSLKLRPNSLCQSNAILKIWLKYAVERNLLTDNSCFCNLNSKGFAVENIALTEDEIKRISDIQFNSELKEEYRIGNKSNIEQSKDLFIFSCHTGFRYSDLQLIDFEVIDQENKTIRLTARKTIDRSVTIPYGQVVEGILKKYEYKLPIVIDKSKFNNHIRLLSKIAGIKTRIVQTDKACGVPVKKEYEKWQLVSSHTGRRSFATNLYLKTRDPLFCMKFTGHTTISNFMKYICISNKELIEKARQYI